MHFDSFKHYREEERYEVNLASGRLSSLLASQAFLFTGWAIIHGPTGTESSRILLIALPAIAFFVCLSALLAIFAAVLVIRRLQWHGSRLVTEDRNCASPPELKDFHIDRKPVDWLHVTGIDMFSLTIPLAFLVLWGILFVHSLNIASSPLTPDQPSSPSPASMPAERNSPSTSELQSKLPTKAMF